MSVIPKCLRQLAEYQGISGERELMLQAADLIDRHGNELEAARNIASGFWDEIAFLRAEVKRLRKRLGENPDDGPPRPLQPPKDAKSWVA